MPNRVTIIALTILIPCCLFGQKIKNISLFTGVSGVRCERFVFNHDINGIKFIPAINISTNLEFETKSIFEFEAQAFYKLALFNQQIFSLFESPSSLSKLKINVSQVGISLLSGIGVDNRWKVLSGINIGYYFSNSESKNYQHRYFNGSYTIKKQRSVSWSIPISIRYRLKKLNNRRNYLELCFSHALITPFVIELQGQYEQPISTHTYFFSGDMIRLGYNITLI